MDPNEPKLTAPDQAFVQMKAIMARLRDPVHGCPWDLEQTFSTIAPYTIEEAYEVADAIARGDMADLREELGDLAFQVFFHSQLAAEIGAFTVEDVLAGLAQKMISRHPHVFAREDCEARSAAEQTEAWELMKAVERQAKTIDAAPSALDNIPHALPALKRAEKISKRAARCGFDWPDHTAVLGKLHEEVDELVLGHAQNDEANVAEEIGDILFVVVNLARKLKVDPEEALRQANRKFETRFRAMEALARAGNVEFASLTLAEQEALWQRVKANQAAENR